jgi:hypothetical protein
VATLLIRLFIGKCQKIFDYSRLAIGYFSLSDIQLFVALPNFTLAWCENFGPTVRVTFGHLFQSQHRQKQVERYKGKKVQTIIKVISQIGQTTKHNKTVDI